jgi:hypothetical protein
MIPLHPVATPDPRIVRWVVPGMSAHLLRTAAEAVAADLAGCGVEVAQAQDGALDLRLNDDRSWRHEGPAVRSLLAQSLHRCSAGAGCVTAATCSGCPARAGTLVGLVRS